MFHQGSHFSRHSPGAYQPGRGRPSFDGRPGGAGNDFDGDRDSDSDNGSNDGLDREGPKDREVPCGSGRRRAMPEGWNGGLFDALDSGNGRRDSAHGMKAPGGGGYGGGARRDMNFRPFMGRAHLGGGRFRGGGPPRGYTSSGEEAEREQAYMGGRGGVRPLFRPDDIDRMHSCGNCGRTVDRNGIRLPGGNRHMHTGDRGGAAFGRSARQRMSQLPYQTDYDRDHDRYGSGRRSYESIFYEC